MFEYRTEHCWTDREKRHWTAQCHLLTCDNHNHGQKSHLTKALSTEWTKLVLIQNHEERHIHEGESRTLHHQQWLTENAHSSKRQTSQGLYSVHRKSSVINKPVQWLSVTSGLQKYRLHLKEAFTKWLERNLWDLQVLQKLGFKICSFIHSFIYLFVHLFIYRVLCVHLSFNHCIITSVIFDSHE